MPRKVCVVVTARPSYSRIKTALKAIRAHSDLELQLVVAASALLDRYGSVVRVVEQDGFDITARVHMVLEGENPVTMAKTAGLGVLELATVFENLKPDVAVTIADRYETLATAVAASFMNVPVVHVQGGEVTGSIDEKVRHAVTKLSNLHMVATEKAAERVISMGEDPETVFVTGCPSIDLASETLNDPGLYFDPIEKYGGVGPMLDLSEGYLVVLQHPVTTECDLAREQIGTTLRAIHGIDFPTLWFWPNVDAGSDGTSKGIRAFREHHPVTKIHFFKNMLPRDFLALINNCRCLVGNSSVGIRECSFLGVPVINIGSRQSGRDRGQNAMDVSHNLEEIQGAVRRQISNGRYERNTIYGDGASGLRIARLLSEVPLKVEKKLTY